MRRSFARFWCEAAGHCFDVIDGPDGDDAALRPNQIFAVSLPESPLSPEQQRRVVDACARHLLTSYGLRSLAPGHPAYCASCSGAPLARDGAYHQGTVWGWLLGPFALAHARVHGDRAAALALLEPMRHHLDDYGVGSIAEIFDGDRAVHAARLPRAGVERRRDAAGVAGAGRRPVAARPTPSRAPPSLATIPRGSPVRPYCHELF